MSNSASEPAFVKSSPRCLFSSADLALSLSASSLFLSHLLFMASTSAPVFSASSISALRCCSSRAMVRSNSSLLPFSTAERRFSRFVFSRVFSYSSSYFVSLVFRSSSKVSMSFVTASLFPFVSSRLFAASFFRF
ncbi:hypothetical protein Barb4_03355 [Bacteroidales bacterium Barb4]|nr:hypothetical protein Barb4_03355 [Bacteroidales bacterium Barb4]